MATYHISSNGEARPCKATKGNCPLSKAGAQHGEFLTQEEANHWAERELSLRSGGTFGSLAVKLAEKTISELAKSSQEAKEADRRAEKAALARAASAAHDILSLESLGELGKMRGFKRQRALKRFQGVAESFGMDRNASLKQLYLAYLRNYSFSTESSSDRAVLRSRVVAGKLVRSSGSSSSSTALTHELQKLEERLDSVPHEEKEELNLAPIALGPDSLWKMKPNEDLMKELADAQERERYFQEWNSKAKIRLVNYGASAGRSAERRRLFGEEYDRIVTFGPAHGFTENEATYFENQQAFRWERYHERLKKEAESRLS